MQKSIGIVFVIFLALVALFDGMTIVKAGEQAVVTRFGAIRPVTLGPGVHFIMPFSDSAHIFSTQISKEQVDASAASHDLQDVHTTVAVNYSLEPVNVNKLFQEIGDDYKNKVIDPAIQEAVKASTANFTAEELVTRRPEVAKQIEDNLSARLAARYIKINAVSIVNFSFSEEFNKAIEAKQVAQQNVEKSKQDLARIEVEANQKIASARAEAESLRLQKEQITPELIQLRQIEAQVAAIGKWNGVLPTYNLGGSTPFINIPAGSK